MSHIRCLCNAIINLSVIPNRQEFRLIWDPRVDEVIDSLVEAYRQATSDDEFKNQAYRSFYRRKPTPPQIYECSNCGRLIVFANPSDVKPAFWFQRERVDGEANSLRSIVEKTIDNEAAT
ncbi:hypothetical protein AB0758_24175 [Tolypothrix bouteillei VB521301_2]|uniref:Uncharacterized protein n=1 Tax=Tolypothrix bouteillei VB521301 TaxID=1479485 RepID=A0A0C1R2K7_9CYAN